VHLGLQVRGQRVGQHARRPALLHGLGEQPPDGRVGEDDLAGDVLPAKSSARAAPTSTTSASTPPAGVG
jgi:hypothetical protein